MCSLYKWCLVLQHCFSITGKPAALFKKPFNFHWMAIFKLFFLNITNPSELKLFNTAIQFLIFANNKANNLSFISLSRLFITPLRCTWVPWQMDDFSLFIHNAVEEYVLQNPVRMYIGIAIDICICITTKICTHLFHFIVHIYTYESQTSGSYSWNTAYDLLYGKFFLVSFMNFPHTLDYCK